MRASHPHVRHRAQRPCAQRRPMLGLAPGGVCLADPVTRAAGGLLHHLFTLTSGFSQRRPVFCGTCRRVTPPGRYPAPRSVEFGLSSEAREALSAPSPSGRPPKVLSLSAVRRDFSRVALSRLVIVLSKKAEALSVRTKTAPQGFAPQTDWLVSLETADSHGVSSLIAALTFKNRTGRGLSLRLAALGTSLFHVLLCQPCPIQPEFERSASRLLAV